MSMGIINCIISDFYRELSSCHIIYSYVIGPDPPRVKTYIYIQYAHFVQHN